MAAPHHVLIERADRWRQAQKCNCPDCTAFECALIRDLEDALAEQAAEVKKLTQKVLELKALTR